MKKVKILCVMIFCGMTSGIIAQDFLAANELVTRRVPWLKNNIAFYKIGKAQNDSDVFTLKTKNHVIIVEASSTSAATKGLGYYLKNYCNRSMSHLGDNLSAPNKIPEVNQPVTIVSNADIRFALNYCTINYTMSFYLWKDWEHELDWMALNGVNLMLTPIGMEKVWQNTLKKMGCDDEEIKKFIAGPAFSAWWLMGNLEGWGGPVSQNIIDQQYELEKKILSRMKSFGIEPVMQGFYGMVPNSLQKKNFSIIPQGTWAGHFQRPAMLSPDQNFDKISGIFYQEIKDLYGSNIHYFVGDPFHEGGKSGDIDVSLYGKKVQDQMQQYFPKSTWLLQGWQKNPSDAILSKIDKSKVLILELFGENTKNWFNRNGYNGTPFIWCTVTNFGDENGLFGKLQRFANEIHDADTGKFAQLNKGVGIMPEGVNNNPVVYDLVLDLAWQQQKVEVTDWIKNFVSARYGTSNEKLQEAWQLFLQTVYRNFDDYQSGAGESIFCARPALDIKSISTWGTRKRNYDTALFDKATKLFVEAGNDSKSLKKSQTYQIDKVDFLKQVNSNIGDILYANMIDAISKKDAQKFKQVYSEFEKLLIQQDALLRSNPYFTLDHWLSQAANFGTNAADKKLAIWNAKVQITYWGPDNNPKTDLHDYANKEWSGLLSSIYLQRWKAFADYQIKKMNGENVVEPDYYKMEVEWAAEAKTAY